MQDIGPEFQLHRVSVARVQLRRAMVFPCSLLLLGLLLIQSGCGAPTQAAADWQAVRSAFTTFQVALRANDPGGVMPLVSAASIARYDELLDLARTASKEELSRRSVYERVQVLTMRMQFSGAELQRLTGKDLLASLIASGSLSKGTIASAQIGEPVFKNHNGDRRCFAQIFLGSESTSNKISFVVEQTWKIDLPKLEYIAENSFAHRMDREGWDEQKLIQEIFREAGHADKLEEMWNPPAVSEATADVSAPQIVTP